MDPKGRAAYRALLDARVAEWEKTIHNLETRVAKKEDAEARAKIALMKERLPQLTEKSGMATTVTDYDWTLFKADSDLLLENLEWLQMYVMRRLGA